MTNIGVVVPIGAGRDILPLIASLDAQSYKPRRVILVWDGCVPYNVSSTEFPIRHVVLPKHEPGMEQPRNAGVRTLFFEDRECTHVLFADSDIVLAPDALEAYAVRACDPSSAVPGDWVMLGPYEWLDESQKGLQPNVRNDPRWLAFDAHDGEVLYGDLGSAVGSFSGNVVWPVDGFLALGGFRSELFHGRCEDGELGLRACENGVGIMYVKGARGYHQAHPIDLPLILERNCRDVPLLAEWHPWVLESLRVVEKDGKRFDWVCPHGRECHLFGIWSGCDCQ